MSDQVPATTLYESVASVRFADLEPTQSIQDADIVWWKTQTSEHFPNAMGAHEPPNEWTPFTQHWGALYQPSDLVWNELEFGGDGLAVMIHELGHGLGLAHPHDGGENGDASKFPSVATRYELGEHGLNQSIYTVMSYNPGLQTESSTIAYGNQGGLGAFDIAALQALYGANLSTATGNNTYKLPTQNARGTGWSCIWDAGGSDTISGENSTAAVTIDLRAATLISHDPHAGGYISQQREIAGGFTIAKGVIIENAIGGSAADRITGNEAANELIGNAGNDILDGGSGIDWMKGGSGNDSYIVDNAKDRITELASQGEDDVFTSVSYTLSDNIENLIARQSFGITLIGNASNNEIWGDEGSNTLNGGAGKDELHGGKGDDTYYVDNVGDQVVEADGNGTADTVHASITYTLAAHVERLYASGSSSIGLTGNSLGNIVKGNSGANKINGGLGNDQLTGGKGKDSFVFDTKLNSKTNKDKILDWNYKDDKIQLENKILKKLKKTGTLKKDHFVLGSKAKDKNDFIGYNKKTGDLWYDTNGSAKGGQVVFANTGKNKKIFHDDFAVI